MNKTSKKANMELPSAIEYLFEALEKESFELQKHLSQCLSEAIDRLPPRHQTPVFKLLQSPTVFLYG